MWALWGCQTGAPQSWETLLHTRLQPGRPSEGLACASWHAPATDTASQQGHGHAAEQHELPDASWKSAGPKQEGGASQLRRLSGQLREMEPSRPF